MEHERPKVGIGVIVLKDGKVLLGERTASHGAGTYQIPGGHLEFGESFEETAKREVLEETGVTNIAIRGLVCIKNDRVYDKHFVTIGLVAEWKAGEPVDIEPLKSKNWSWYSPEEMPENLFLPSRAVLEQWKAGTIYTP